MNLDQVEIQKFNEYFNVDFNKPFERVEHKKRAGKSLILADVHAPYCSEKLGEIISHNYDAEKLFLIGDWFDLLSKTFFRKTCDIDFRREFKKAYELLREISRHFNEVHFMMANHDNRFMKWIFDNVPSDTLQFCRISLVEDLVELIPNLRIMKHRICGRDVGYIYQHKNILFTHIEKSNIDITKTAQEINKEFAHRWGGFFDFKDYDIIAQAHNHSSGKVRVGNKYVVQLPCVIDIAQPAFDYVFNGKLKGNPPALGFATMLETEEKVIKESFQIYDIFD